MPPPSPPGTARPRHPDKDIEKLLKKAEARGWVFTRGTRYFKGRCPCGRHVKTVHLTPNAAYIVNLRHWFARLDCWEEEP